MIELYELNPHKMTTPQEKAQCVSWFIETKSDVQIQRNYRSKYGRDSSSRPSMRLLRCTLRDLKQGFSNFFVLRPHFQK